MKHNATCDFKSLTFLPKNIEEIWDYRVPKVWAGSSIWCESAIEAMRNMGREDLIERINFEALYLEFVAKNFFYRRFAYDLTNNKVRLFYLSSFKIISRYFSALCRLIKRKIFKRFDNKGSLTKLGLNNIIEANRFIESICK